MKIVVDVMGGDDAPQAVLAGVRLFLDKHSEDDLLLVGEQAVLEPFSESLSEPQRQRVVLRYSTQTIEFDEHAADAVRAKPDSSIVLCARALKAGEADAFFSAGSTGAVMAAATLICGRIKGVSRPAIATLIPTATGSILLLDSGANADVKASYLVQFARLARVYCQVMEGIENPRIALLNIGEESTKGSALYQEAHQLLQGSPGFIGNLEGRSLFSGQADALICDGFSGNVVLKTVEGAASFLFHEVKRALMASTKAKLGALLIKSSLSGLKQTFSAEAAGSAPLLGVRGNVLIGHGSSNDQAILHGLEQSARTARQGLAAQIEAALHA